MNKQVQEQQAHKIANLIKEASQLIGQANALMTEYDLNLENYPENWLDFQEHPSELLSIIVTDFDELQVEVGGTR